MPAKAGIQVRAFPGLPIALAVAGLPGTTDVFCREFRLGYANEIMI